jgi:hypothetical protein
MKKVGSRRASGAMTRRLLHYPRNVNRRSQQHPVEIDYYRPPPPRPWWHWATLGLIAAWTLAASAVLPWIFYRIYTSFMAGF